ncbi:TPA: restriction endonuclease subunit S [Vibrio parahaemolyticus]|nr:restriction endonuclease subunit S [Vibrio parahaemolyticus]
MGSEWKTAKLTDHYEIRSGLSKPAKDFGSGYPFLTFKDVFYNYFTPDTLGDLVESTEKDRVGCSVNRGDVFLTRTSETMNELGMSCVALKDYENSTFNGFCKRLRPRAGSDLVPEYVGYYLRSPLFRRSMMAFSTMSTRASLNNEMISRLDISYPSPAEQVEIARVLKTLDDKIFLNNQINQTLEQMAQAIFKSWFVDFDPVKAKMNGEQPEGMDAATASLFPEKLVESELGLIPEGWEVKPLDKVAHFQNGLALQKFRPESEEDDFLPVLKIAQLRQGYCDGKEKARTDIKESCRVYDGDMIFSWSGTLMIDLWTGGNAALNQHLFKVTSEEYNLPLYLYWTKHHLAKFQQIAKDKAVTMGHIKRGHLSESLCVIPPRALRDKMDKVLLPLINQGLNLRLQSNQLATLRDTLLPKLLSGEIELGQSVEVSE